MYMIFSSCASLRNFGPSRQICISRSILFLLRDLHKGDTRRFLTEKPCSTPEFDCGISNGNLKSFILFRKLWTEPSEHIFEYTLLSVGLIVFKYSSISFCFVSLFTSVELVSLLDHLILWRLHQKYKRNLEIQLLVPAMIWWPLLELNHLGKRHWFNFHSDCKGCAFVLFFILLTVFPYWKCWRLQESGYQQQGLLLFLITSHLQNYNQFQLGIFWLKHKARVDFFFFFY